MTATATKTSPDVLAMEMPDVVREAVQTLGGQIVGVIGGVSSSAPVGQWMRGERGVKSEDREMRIRIALRLVRDLQFYKLGEKTIRAWFLGANPYFNDEAPVAVLATMPILEVQKQLITAAGAFGSRLR